MTQDELKKKVAEAALRHVVEDAVVGVGSGSTVNLFIDALAKMKGRIGHMHMCDTDNNTWCNAFGTHLAIGTGVIDFDAFVPAIMDAGYSSPWWSVDAIPMNAGAWADTWTDKFALDALLDKYVRNR